MARAETPIADGQDVPGWNNIGKLRLETRDKAVFENDRDTLSELFTVLATQNPIEYEGTYPLPEAQLDRFMFNVKIGYLPEEEEIAVVKQTTSPQNYEFQRLMSADEIIAFQRLVRQVPASDTVARYAVRLVNASRPGTPPASSDSSCTRPAVWLLSRSTDLVVKVLGGDPNQEREEISAAEARQRFLEENEPYKVELVETAEGPISLYSQEGFTDLCRGPHLQDSKPIKAVKLTSLAGAYWRGDEKNTQLTRIYGTAFYEPEDLEHYLERLEEAKRRDHRRLGRQLDLFHFDEHSPGSPFWHPKGMVLFNVLEDLRRREPRARRRYLRAQPPNNGDARRDACGPARPLPARRRDGVVPVGLRGRRRPRRGRPGCGRRGSPTG